jgi:hypothetical protein
VQSALSGAAEMARMVRRLVAGFIVPSDVRSKAWCFRSRITHIKRCYTGNDTLVQFYKQTDASSMSSGGRGVPISDDYVTPV